MRGGVAYRDTGSTSVPSRKRNQSRTIDHDLSWINHARHGGCDEASQRVRRSAISGPSRRRQRFAGWSSGVGPLDATSLRKPRVAREERIERERIELQFVFDDLAAPDQEAWNLRAALTIRAKRLIDSQFVRSEDKFGPRTTGFQTVRTQDEI